MTLLEEAKTHMEKMREHTDCCGMPIFRRDASISDGDGLSAFSDHTVGAPALPQPPLSTLPKADKDSDFRSHCAASNC